MHVRTNGSAGQRPSGTAPAEARRADPPRPPETSPAVAKARAERQTYLRGREHVEQRSILRGLILLAIVVLIFSIARAGLGRTFFSGWWRGW